MTCKSGSFKLKIKKGLIFKNSKFLSLRFYVSESFAFLYVCALCVFLVTIEARRGPQIPGTGPIKEGCELVSLQEEQVLITTEPSLQLPHPILKPLHC